MERVSNVKRLNETEIVLKSSFRTMAIFEFFADFKKPATIGDISNTLKIPQSSTSSLVKSLVDTGFLAKTSDTRCYFPTSRLTYLSIWRNKSYPFAAQFHEGLVELSGLTGETVVLAMRNGIYSQYILVEHAHGILKNHIETGSVRPLACNASGWAMLANDSDQEIGKLIRKTELAIDNMAWLETIKTANNHISYVRNHGFAFSQDVVEEGSSALACALPTTRKRSRLSVSLAGPKDRLTKNRGHILVQLRDFIDQLPKNITEQILI